MGYYGPGVGRYSKNVLIALQYDQFWNTQQKAVSQISTVPSLIVLEFATVVGGGQILQRQSNSMQLQVRCIHLISERGRADSSRRAEYRPSENPPEFSRRRDSSVGLR